MSSIDTRVVEAQFKNQQFSKGVADTEASLGKLKNSLRLDGATDGSTNAARGLSELGNTTDGVAGRFSAMSAIAFGALASIGQRAMSTATQMASAFTTGPIVDGFREYETNMNSIQTVLANTQVSGAGLNEVNAALDELNIYSDKTIYNFSEMAKNIGTFTAAGVDLDTATGSIKGIANLAALSGSNSQQASGAMYQLSQAISAGRVSLQDWNSVVNAGMGGTVFQRALAQTATQMGTLSEGAVKLEGDMQNVTIEGASFRESLDATNGPSWLTSDVLTATLNQFTGDMTDAELAAQGFSAEMIASIQAQAQTATKAATEVKTFSGLVDTLKEGITSGWSQTFRYIIGDFEEAKVLFTGLSNSIGGFFGRIAENRNTKLSIWKDLGGRDKLIEGLTDAFWAFGAPLAQIGAAFREIFPASTATDLLRATDAFAAFMAKIQPAPETLDRIRRTFAGVFAVVGIVWEVIKGLAGVIGDLIGRFSEGEGGILKFTASIGDFLVGLHESIKTGQGLGDFFDGLSSRLGKVVDIFQSVTNFFGELFGGLDLGPLGSQLGDLVSKVLSFGSATDESTTLVDKITTAFGKLRDMIENVGEWFGDIGSTMAGAFDNLDYEKVMGGLQTGMIAGVGGVLLSLASSIRNFSVFGGGNSGLFAQLSEGLDQVSGSLQSMQNSNNASALFKLAAAIALLAVAVMLLAQLDAGQLTRASIALGVLFLELTKGMTIFNKAVGIMGAAKLNLIGPALITIGLAVLIFVGAIALLASMSWADLAKGMTALGILLGMLVTAVVVMSGHTKGMALVAASFVLMAIAINLLVLAVKQIAAMDWGELAKGLGGVAAILTGLALFTRFAKVSAGSVASGASLAILAGGIYLMAMAVQKLAELSWADMLRGLAGMTIALGVMGASLKLLSGDVKLIVAAVAIAHVAGALGLIADVFIRLAGLSWGEVIRAMMAFATTFGMVTIAIKAIEKVNIAQLAGLALVTAAIMELAGALEIMGKLSFDEIARGLVAMVGSIGILVIAMIALSKVPDSAGFALAAISASMALLAPALATMAAIPMVGIAAALLILSGVFVVLGVAAAKLGPYVPTLIGLSIAVALLGVAMALAGAGVALFAIGLTTLGAAGAAATAGIVAIVSGLIGLIPLVMEQIGLGIIAFAEVIITAGPAIVEAITVVLTSMMQAIIDTTPKIVETLLTLLFNFLTVLDQAIPAIVEAGMNLLIALLDGIAANMGDIVDSAADIIIEFIDGIARNIGDIIQAGIDLIIAFMRGIGDGIRNNGEAIADAAWDMVTGLIDGIVDGLASLGGRILDAMWDMVSAAWDGVLSFFGIESPSKEGIWVGRMIDQGIANGLTRYSSVVEESAVDMSENALNTLSSAFSGMNDVISDEMDDLNPVITPVLDLSGVQRDSAMLTDILAAKPIDLADAFSKAGDASAGYNANQDELAELVSSASTNVSMVQNNYSPKALSPVEVYRNTDNQLSQVRGALRRVNQT